MSNDPPFFKLRLFTSLGSAAPVIPMLLMLVVQIVSGIPEPGYLLSLGREGGIEAAASRVLFSTSSATRNLLHIPVFAGLVVSWVLALRAKRTPSRHSLRTAVLITLLFGIANELSQLLVPTRVADLRDLALNWMGVAAGAAICWGLDVRERPPARGGGSDG